MCQRIERSILFAVKLGNQDDLGRDHKQQEVLITDNPCRYKSGDGIHCSSGDDAGYYLGSHARAFYHQVVFVHGPAKQKKSGYKKRNRMEPKASKYKNHYPDRSQCPGGEITQFNKLLTV